MGIVCRDFTIMRTETMEKATEIIKHTLISWNYTCMPQSFSRCWGTNAPMLFFFCEGIWISYIHNFLDTSIITFMKRSLWFQLICCVHKHKKDTQMDAHSIKFTRRHGKMEQNYFLPSLGQLVYFLLVVTLRGVSGTKVTRARETWGHHTRAHPVKAQNFLNFW